MALTGVRLVLDTNCLLRGLARPEAASGRVLSAIEDRTVLLLTSKRVLEEYRVILLDPVILARYPMLQPITVEATLRSLEYLSEGLGVVRTRFDFPRDPKDEKFLALAIAGHASHLITYDRDLLSLTDSHDDAAKRLRQRLPRLHIQTPNAFLGDLRDELEKSP